MLTKSSAAVLTASALLVLPATSAMALTITNKDSKKHTIGIDLGDKEIVNKVPAGGSVTFKDECNSGCGVTGPWSYSVMLKTNDKFEFGGKPLVTIAK